MLLISGRMAFARNVEKLVFYILDSVQPQERRCFIEAIYTGPPRLIIKDVVLELRWSTTGLHCKIDLTSIFI